MYALFSKHVIYVNSNYILHSAATMLLQNARYSNHVSWRSYQRMHRSWSKKMQWLSAHYVIC